MSVSPRRRNNDGESEQCLLYYYYMTYNNSATSHRNQTIEIYMSPNSAPSNRTLIDIITQANMTHNGWQNRTVKINSSTDTYEVNDSQAYREIV